MLVPLVFAATAILAPAPRAVHRGRCFDARMAVQPVDDAWSSTGSGLQYLDLSVGGGDQAERGNVVKVLYTGWIEETGVKFDSSEGALGSGPISFPVGKGRVIKGWDEGMLAAPAMRAGGRRRLSIPAGLAYGESGFNDIPPNARLQFECEIVAVEGGIKAALAAVPLPYLPPNVVRSLPLLVGAIAVTLVPYALPPEMVPSWWVL